MKRMLLELGGKGAALVFDDADVKTAVQMIGSVWTFHSGQICTAPTRAIVQRAIYDQVVEGLAKMAKVLKVGDPYEPDTVVGPVITAQHRDRVEGYIRVGRDEGGEILAGGERPEKPDRGFYVAPTLIAGCRPGMRVVQEEIFGPVIVAVPFDDDDEGIAIANGTDFGLYDYVFSARHQPRVPRQQAHARRQRRHQHDAAQPQHAVRRQQDERRRPRRRGVRVCTRTASCSRSCGRADHASTGAEHRLDRSRRRRRVRDPAPGPGAVDARRRCRRERERGTVDDMVRVAQACDAAGFLYVAACHHVAIPREPAEVMSHARGSTRSRRSRSSRRTRTRRGS